MLRAPRGPGIGLPPGPHYPPSLEPFVTPLS